MKLSKVNFKKSSIITTSLFFVFLFAFLFVNLNQIKQANAAVGCGFDPKSVAVGGSIGIIVTDLPGINVAKLYTYGGSPITLGNINGGTGGAGGNTFTIPSSATAPEYQVRVQTSFGGEITCAGGNLTITSVGIPPSAPPPSGIGAGSIGTINPGTLPTVGSDPSSFVANLIKAGISLLLIIAFIIDLLWTIFAGIRFITAGGDPKTVGQAWSQIYWGLIGMVVVVGSFAIIKLVETFFSVSIISGGFKLPTI